MFGWQGLAYDDATGKWDNLARQYDQNIGTFTIQDPIGAVDPRTNLVIDTNLYRYVLNNPVRYVDPDGHRAVAPEGGGGNLPSHIPPGVDIQKNIEEARNMSPLEFERAVRTGGKWDYKRLGRQYEDFGNYNYGVTGRACGFSEGTLKRAAGAYQIYSGTSSPDFGTPFDVNGPYGDDPTDQSYIGGGNFDYENIYGK